MKRTVVNVAIGMVAGALLVGGPAHALSEKSDGDRAELASHMGEMMSDPELREEMKPFMSEMMSDREMRKQMQSMMSEAMKGMPMMTDEGDMSMGGGGMSMMEDEGGSAQGH